MPNYKLLCLELADQLERSAFAHRDENESRLTFEKYIEFIEYIRATIPLGNTETAFDYKDLCNKLIERLQSSLEAHFAYGNKKACLECQQVLTRARIALIPDEQLLNTYALALTAVVDDAPMPWPTGLVNQAQLVGLRAVLNRYGNPTP